jgi:hypothetical protein
MTFKVAQVFTPVPMNAEAPVFLEVHDSEHNDDHGHFEDGTVVEDLSGSQPLVDVDVIVVPPLAGGPEDFSFEVPSTPAEELVVSENSEDSKQTDKKDGNDTDDSKKSKKMKWDWQTNGADGFFVWVKERLDNIPKHSGYDTAGVERAISYLETLDGEISSAMRKDLDGELDADKIEKARSEIEKGLNRLEEWLDKLKSSKKRKKKKADLISDSLIKEGQKITGVQGIFVTAPLFISALARICINGAVSAGHDIEDMYNKLVKKHKLDDREKVELVQLLDDMGFPIRRDRGFMGDEDVDVSSSDNFDYMANYKG